MSPTETASDTYVPRLKAIYRDKIRTKLSEELGLHLMATPTLDKVCLNMGVGEMARGEKDALENAITDLKVISGQKPLVTTARKSIANFKLREGMDIGAKVTLRGNRAWEFFDRLITLAIPRIRDFRGLSPKGFDGNGNYTFGVNDQTIFPEIEYDKIGKVRGMDITLVTTAKNDEQGRALLAAFGFPFKK